MKCTADYKHRHRQDKNVGWTLDIHGEHRAPAYNGGLETRVREGDCFWIVFCKLESHAPKVTDPLPHSP